MSARPSDRAVADARHRLGLAEDADLAQAKKAFRQLALTHHPDKGGDAEQFQALSDALEVVEAFFAAAEAAETLPGGRDTEGVDVADDRRGLRRYVPAKKQAAVQDGSGARGRPGRPNWGKSSIAWRCTECEEGHSICCRLNPRKYFCLCGHKLEAHDETGCAGRGCACKHFEFQVANNGWQVRCQCKHKHTDHAVGPLGPKGHRRPCTKKGCSCSHFCASWVCNCDHGWAAHETVPVDEQEVGWAGRSGFREWVTHGLRPDCVKEAEANREKWAQQAADVATRPAARPAPPRPGSARASAGPAPARPGPGGFCSAFGAGPAPARPGSARPGPARQPGHGVRAADDFVEAKVQSMKISAAAEARMRRAVREAHSSRALT